MPSSLKISLCFHNSVGFWCSVGGFCISALSYGVSLDFLFLWPFWTLDVPLIIKLLYFPSRYWSYHLRGNSLSNLQRADGMAQSSIYIFDLFQFTWNAAARTNTLLVHQEHKERSVWAPFSNMHLICAFNGEELCILWFAAFFPFTATSITGVVLFHTAHSSWF